MKAIEATIKIKTSSVRHELTTNIRLFGIYEDKTILEKIQFLSVRFALLRKTHEYINNHLN